MTIKPLSFAAAAGLCIATFAVPAAAHDEPVVGSLGGAAVGAIAGGPVGAAVGAVLGAAIGATVAHETDHGHRHARHAHRHYGYRESDPRTGRVVHIESVRYEPAGAVVYNCEPQHRAYAPRVVHRDERVKVVQTSTTTKTSRGPQLVGAFSKKKVCRYVPVKTTTTASVTTRRAVS